VSAEAIFNWWLASIIAEFLLAGVFAFLAIWCLCHVSAQADDIAKQHDLGAEKVVDRG